VGDQDQLQSTVVLIPSPSTLRLIRENLDVLYNRINVRDYEEYQNDIQAASGIAEDIRGALLDYQVRSGKAHATIAPLNLRRFDRWHSNTQCMTRIAG